MNASGDKRKHARLLEEAARRPGREEVVAFESEKRVRRGNGAMHQALKDMGSFY